MNIRISNCIEYFDEWAKKCENSKYSKEIKNYILLIETYLNDDDLTSEEKAENIVETILEFNNKWFSEIFDYTNSELELILKYVKYVKSNLIIDITKDVENYKFKKDVYESQNVDESQLVMDKIVEFYDNDSIKNINVFQFNDFLMVKHDILWFTIGEYLIYYILDKGFGYVKINDDYEDIVDIIEKYFTNVNKEPTPDEKLTSLLYKSIDFSNFEEYSEIYSIVSNYDDNLTNSFTNEILFGENLSTILYKSSKLYIKGQCIVNKLYSLDNEKVDFELFPLNYPWNESFDDIMAKILFLFNEIYNSLSEIKNLDLNEIIDINTINEENKIIDNEGETKNLNELFLDFEKEVISLTNLFFNNDIEWNQIFKNKEFKELLELLKYSFNYDDELIKKYFETQNNIDYKIFN